MLDEMKKNLVLITILLIAGTALCVSVAMVACMVPAGQVEDGTALPTMTIATPADQKSSNDDRALYDQRVTRAEDEDEAAGAGTAFVPKQVLVVFKEGTTVQLAEGVLQVTDAVATKTVVFDDTSQPSSVVILQVADDASVADAVAALKTSQYVETAQPNYIYHLMDDGAAIQ